MSRRSRHALRLAALYNVVAGAAFVLFGPGPAWKCVGMMVAVYAPGYWLAARRPNPELVAVGLLGKVLGPVGFIWACAAGLLPGWFALVVLADDVIWWRPFARYLREARALGAPGQPAATASGSPNLARATNRPIPGDATN